MAMTYDEAMGTLCAMFDTFDRETISCVLEMNRGQLESTIDTLLGMQADINGEPAPVALLPAARVALPDDFLRLPGYTSAMEQEAQDRMMAEMLQNEDFFRNELMADGEFSAYLGTSPHHARASPTRRLSNEKSAMEVANETLSAVSGKLSTMSVAMRNKMYAMYSRFQTRNDAAARADPGSRRRLMSMSDEEDDDDDRRQPANDERETMHRRKTSGSEEDAAVVHRGPTDAASSSSSWGHSKSD
ncbi:hypothetical protein SPRG_01344 [Saprolegnia parasitica CBS 223.65]|uniref:CUE domain-containing protein n=1 Tax=Saprolegnia parasitica (strain CBS 223.65) TaxID=695850 RepID=A0A067CXT5_SAPPC|nr:hypothetical protein SPRG_01344 [Saprolegnia parasitica CBS 223.65]KDO34070.1 hypothetical protein SPRG_01344 [Saprolegnia parasitica CBS 223.65]|eukprot:XP_012194954.1 hypothetical protein SPRG_01344 [Saprolegnia parasitica CBS 223.65]